MVHGPKEVKSPIPRASAPLPDKADDINHDNSAIEQQVTVSRALSDFNPWSMVQLPSYSTIELSSCRQYYIALHLQYLHNLNSHINIILFVYTSKISKNFLEFLTRLNFSQIIIYFYQQIKAIRPF